MTDWIEVADHGDTLRITFDDLLKYHGRHSIGGVAHGLKMLQRAFSALSPGRPPLRGTFTVFTAFPGPGARDAIEMVTRAVTAGRYTVDTGFDAQSVPEAPFGRYFFRIGHEGRTVDLGAKPGLVRPEFIDILRKKAATGLNEAEESRLVELKQEMAGRLVAMPAEDIYEVLAQS